MTDLGTRDFLDHNPIVGEQKVGERRFWTTREEKVLRESYPAGGLEVCLPLLPGRSASSIYQRAGQLELRKHDGRGRPGAPRERWQSNDHIDALIRRTYQGEPRMNAIKALAKTVARPRWWVSSRARKLGMVSPRFKEPEWTEAELEVIQENAHKSLATLRRMLIKSGGFPRSETAIHVKLKRLGADRSDPDHYTACGLSALMGIDVKGVTAWILKGWLRADRRGTARGDEQHGDHWWIHKRDVAAFIVNNVASVDFRKIDKFWLVDLLVHDARPGGEKRTKGESIIAIAAARPDLRPSEIAAMVESTAKSVSVVLSRARHGAAA